MFEPAAEAGAVDSAVERNATADARLRGRSDSELMIDIQWFKVVIAGRTQGDDLGEFAQSAVPAPTVEDSDDIDRFGDQGAGHGDDRFLNQLFETEQRPACRSGMNSTDAAGVTGTPGLEQVQGFGTAHLTDGNAVGPQAK